MCKCLVDCFKECLSYHYKTALVLSCQGIWNSLIAYKLQTYLFCFVFHWRLRPPSYFLLFLFPFLFLQLCQHPFLASDASFVFPFLSLRVSVAVLFSPFLFPSLPLSAVLLNPFIFFFVPQPLLPFPACLLYLFLCRASPCLWHALQK